MEPGDKLQVGIRELDAIMVPNGLFGLSKVQGHNSYPGFSTDPLAGFRHLREDLERFGEVFLKGSDEEFRALKNWINVHPNAIGLRGLHR